MKTLHELSQELAKKQPHQVDSLTEEAPILKRIPFEASSHPLWNTYEDVVDVEGAGWVNMNAPLPTVDASTRLVKVDLSILGGEIECPEDTAQMFGGKEKYFAKKMPKVLRKSGMTAEKAILYNNFLAYAKDENKLINAGASTGGTYSLIAVRFVAGETCGLYSPEGFKQGTMLDTRPIAGGQLYKATSGTYAGVLVYGLRLKSYLGLQIANPNTVAAIVNINSSNKPTETMVDDLIAMVRGSDSGHTMLFCHERCKNMLYSYKGNSLQVTNKDKDMNRMLTHWNGVEVVTSYNFTDGEDTAITVS
ncbi:MAG: hypothetical protein R3Y11_03900 [Pseudomonadota bacterium]